MVANDTFMINRRQERFVAWVMDILVYTVVLGLFVEHVDSVVIDSFTIVIGTAVLLKALLAAIVGLEHRVSVYFKQRGGTVNRVLGIVATLSILFWSKFVILEAVDIVFGDHVELGGFFMIVALIIAMMAARAVVQLIYKQLGATTNTAA
jgi:hypothetical protein